jgi:hypothetical protein
MPIEDTAFTIAADVMIQLFPLLLLPQESLNAFMALGKPAWQEARATLTRLLSKAEGRLRDDAALRQAAIIPQVRRHVQENLRQCVTQQSLLEATVLLNRCISTAIVHGLPEVAYPAMLMHAPA